jgi:hypothetical protein
MDSEDEEEGKTKRVQKLKRDSTLSPNEKVKKYLDDHVDVKESLKLPVEGGIKYGNKTDKKDASQLFLPPSAINSSRKRTHDQSTSRMSMSSKMPPSNSISAKINAFDDSCYSDFCSDDDFGSTTGRSKLTEMIGRLGTELQQKVRAKKQKLAEQFKSKRP